jgi:hemoglobin
MESVREFANENLLSIALRLNQWSILSFSSLHRTHLTIMDPIGNLHSEIGETTIQTMVAGFYRRVKQDDILGPMYPADDWEGSEKRLADFLIFRFGGSQRYLAERGHPRLRARHFPFIIDAAARDRWLKLMGEAMEEVTIPESSAETIRAFFHQVAHMMQNTGVGH